MSRTHLRSLVQLYLALAFRPDGDVDPNEADAILALLREWVPPSEHPFVADELDAGLRLERRGDAMSVEGLVLSLRPWLDAQERSLVFADLERIAEADGVRSQQEAALMNRVHQVWSA